MVARRACADICRVPRLNREHANTHTGRKTAGVVMGYRSSWRTTALLAAAVLIGSEIAGCGGSTPPQQPAPTGTGTPPVSVATGTGTLTVSVTDPEGQPLAGASVNVFNVAQTATVGSAKTGTNGLATVGSVPAAARVYVHHEFGTSYRNTNVGVAQEGATFLEVTLQPARPQPTVALLPVSISPGSVSADRSELALEVTIVASAAAPFVPAGYGDYSPRSTPSLGLALGDWDEWGSPRPCFVWLDRTRTAPSCGTPWGESPYTVSVEEFAYDAAGTVPVLAVQSPTQSTMLVMDQSERVRDLDPAVRRSFAARHFIARVVTSSQWNSLAVAGFAGDGNGPAALPERPLWVPRGSGTAFSTDRAVLEAGVGILEPLVGGSAPVFGALRAAFALTAAEAPSGNRAVVALLGGGDDSDMSDSARQAALAVLRQQRDDAGIQSILITAAPEAQRGERLALAELSAALRAPAISLGVTYDSSAHTWASGSFAALDLAADLIDGVPLPTLSAVFRVKADHPDAFPPGTTLHGAIYVESIICPMGCWEIPLEFAVEIP